MNKNIVSAQNPKKPNSENFAYFSTFHVMSILLTHRTKMARSTLFWMNSSLSNCVKLTFNCVLDLQEAYCFWLVGHSDWPRWWHLNCLSVFNVHSGCGKHWLPKIGCMATLVGCWSFHSTMNSFIYAIPQKKMGCMHLSTPYERTLPSLWRCSKYSWWVYLCGSNSWWLVRILTEDPSYLLLIINRFWWNN